MAGGSADGAAALVALDGLVGAGLDGKLSEAAAKLGSDVPFSLSGGTAIGLGRGEKLSKIETSAVLHWVITPNSDGLSTPEVYRKLDIIRVEAGMDVSKLEQPEVPESLVAALVSGNAYEVAEYMHNDLEVAALALRPELSKTIAAGKKAGSLKSMVSGSGPTIAHLALDRVHAEQIVNRLSVAGFPSFATHTSLDGTRLEY
jgi:4-diphosphocytidyl-2-C-methyl-D-erythritol kinase